MPDFIFLMHDDASAPVNDEAWSAYLGDPRISDRLQGGSAIGDGICVRKADPTPPITKPLTGFLRIEADSLEHAQSLVAGNPVFEAGGTVEIRALPRTD